jgi:hypothetical protein
VGVDVLLVGVDGRITSPAFGTGRVQWLLGINERTSNCGDEN